MTIPSPDMKGCEGFIFGHGRKNLVDLPEFSMVKTRVAKRVKHPVTLCVGVSHIVESIAESSVPLIQIVTHIRMGSGSIGVWGKESSVFPGMPC